MGQHMFTPLNARSAKLERQLFGIDASIRDTYVIRDEDEEIDGRPGQEG